MNNMELYELGRQVPDEAKKPITAGRLKGFTDINPMWRIKRLTEMFGPCGIGWWYEITDKRMEAGANSEIGVSWTSSSFTAGEIRCLSRCMEPGEAPSSQRKRTACIHLTSASKWP